MKVLMFRCLRLFIRRTNFELVTLGVPMVVRTKTQKGYRMSEETEEVTEEAEPKSPTQAELDREKAESIVAPLASAGKTDEAMIVALITQGDFRFKYAGQLLQLALEKLGVRMSNKERYSHISEYLMENVFSPETWEDVMNTAEYFAQELDATDEKQALVAIKKFAKENDITLPGRPKGIDKRSGGTRHGFTAECFQWMVDNANSSEEEFITWLDGEGKRKELKRHFVRVFQTGQAMAKNINA